MRRFLIGWILIVLLLPFAAAWIYSEWSEKNQQIEQESSQLQIDVQMVSGVQRMGTSDFLIGAIAGQIPAEFEVETLKAQAVMARSCLYKQAGDRYYISASDTGMTWCSETERKKMWGTSYKENNDRIRQAVRETDGQILYSEGGQMILPAWFYIGNGKTRSAKEAWGEETSWFQSVESSWDTESPEYETTTEMTKRQLIRQMKRYDPAFDCPAETLASNCEITAVDSAGYVTEIQIGNRLMSGEDFRYALELPSACFKIAFESNQVQIRVYGRGHGVGFDQYGANRQAKEGKNYEQLLQYYLTGVKVGE